MPDFNVLEDVRIASPCGAAWDQMRGTEQVRFCAECGKHVYNLSAMSRGEAETLIRAKEGRVCARLYRRRDGTVLTDNCPVGQRRMRRAFLMQVSLIAGIFVLIPGGAALAARLGPESPLWWNEPWRSIGERLGIVQPPLAVMGDVAVLPAPPPTGSSRPASKP